MKRSLLFLSAVLIVSGGLFAQNKVEVTPGDVPGSLILNPKPATKPFWTPSNDKKACAAAVTIGDSICNPDSGTVSATGGVFIDWYDAAVGGNLVGTGASFTSPLLSVTTSYYAEANCLDTNMMDVSTHSSTYSGNTRGYWFVAPVDFVITGVRVPTDVGTGDQSIQLLLFNTAPPIFPAITNDFTSLGLWQNVVGTNIISTFINVTAGDSIAVLGSRAGMNSYTPGFTTMIDGNNVDLYRCFFQQDLALATASDVSAGAAGSNISRVELYYSIAETASRSQAEIVVVSCTAVEEVTFENQISVYPNPSAGTVWVENAGNMKVEIKLFDVTGKNISTVISTKSAEKLDLNDLANGTYFVQIINNNESLVKKVILNK